MPQTRHLMTMAAFRVYSSADKKKNLKGAMTVFLQHYLLAIS